MRTWQDILQSSNEEIIRWAGGSTWAAAMRTCQQDAIWHAEGDVWTHTLMVCGEVEKLDGYPKLVREEQLKLLFTALLHDAGKPATTALDPETGRLRSLRHSLVGSTLARGVLSSLGCPLKLREEIVRLVRYHGRPPYLLEKAHPEQEVIRLSCLLRNRLLHLFALADTRGRDAGETVRTEEMLNLWRDVAVEHGCYDGPYPFANAQARFLYFREPVGDLHHVPHEDYKCRVIMMSGLPGVGKDTWLARNRPELPVVSLDAVRDDLDVDATDNQGRVIQEARERCRQHLRAGEDFAFNATNLTVSLRKRWLDLFASYGAWLEMVYLENDLKATLKRNAGRAAPVPASVIEKLARKVEVPDLSECHALHLLDLNTTGRE